MSKEFLKNFLEMSLSAMKSWNNLAKSAAEGYVRSLSKQNNIS